MYKQFFSLLITLILLSSCKNNTQRSETFVSDYNKLANETKNSLIYKTYAKLYSEKIPNEYIIDVIIELSIKKSEYKSYLGYAPLTKTIADLITSSDIEELIKTGAKINLKYKSFDNYFVEENIMDLNMLNEIKQIKIFGTKKSLSIKQLKIVRELEKINLSLPYSNQDVTKLLRFELDQWNNINCYVEYDGDYESFSKYAFKERMYSTPFIKSILNKENNFDIISITYKFQLPSGQKLGDYMIKP